MVRVRLSRGGGKKRPYYHIVVVDQKSKRDGKCIERIGSYDPNLENERRITLKQDRLDYWINLGAQMSERVKLLRKYTQDPDNLEKRQKVKSSLEKNKARRLKAKEAEAAPAEEKAEAAPAEEKAEAVEAAPAEEKAEAAPAEEKAEAAPAEEAEAAPAEEKQIPINKKKLNLLILGLFHEKRLYCYHRKDTSHTWH